MKKLFFFLFLSISSPIKACSLRAPTVLLSAPLVHILAQLGLLKDPNLLAITSFAALKSGESKAKILNGGIFISPQVLKIYSEKKVHLFYDQSIDLSRTLKHYNWGHLQVYSSLKLDPFEAVEKGLSLLTLELKDCEQEVKKFRQNLQKRKENWSKKKAKKNLNLIFALGEVREGKRRPPILMVNDGAILFLLRQKQIESYPTDLPYVSWAEKEMRSMQNPQWIGLVDDAFNDKNVNLHWEGNNLFGRAFLVPGLAQMQLLEKIYERFF